MNELKKYCLKEESATNVNEYINSLIVVLEEVDYRVGEVYKNVNFNDEHTSYLFKKGRSSLSDGIKDIIHTLRVKHG